MNPIGSMIGTAEGRGPWTKEVMDRIRSMRMMTEEKRAEFLGHCRENLRTLWLDELANVHINHTSGLTKQYNEMVIHDQLIEDELLDTVPLTAGMGTHTLMYLYGANRIGKSITLQHYISEYARQYQCPVHYITSIDFVYRVTALDNAEKRKLINHLVEHYKILVIDEIDKVHLTDAREMIFFYLLDKRKTGNVITILCGNEVIEDLEKKLGHVICSRIQHEALIMNWCKPGNRVDDDKPVF